MAGGTEQEMLRAARNQALYREVNEKIVALNEAFNDLLDAGSTWVCECHDENCTASMELTLGEYEQLRAHPNRFAVLPGHVKADVERVVEEHKRYLVAAKVGIGEAYAITNDPRAHDRPTSNASHAASRGMSSGSES